MQSFKFIVGADKEGSYGRRSLHFGRIRVPALLGAAAPPR